MTPALVMAALPHLAGLLGKPEVRSLVDSTIALFGRADQITLKARLAELQAENDVGHDRLQDKLAAKD